MIAAPAAGCYQKGSAWLPGVRRGGGTIEIDTLEYQQTEKIETELKDVDRIRANRCTQLCPGSPSGASHSHKTIYYSFPADSPPSRKEAPRWKSSVQDNPAAPSPCQMREF